MNVALLGYGTVGKNVEKLCIENGINVCYILRRNTSQINKENMTTDINVILNDDNVDCVIECMGGESPAYEYVKNSLLRRKDVVTSNKKMLAKHFLELTNLASDNGKSLLFSSSCGGGIPWIGELTNIASSDVINSFKGIMNGTTNYILDNMANSNISFDEALKKAQELGFAEADPSDDIDGVDTANKVLLSAGVAFNYQFSIEDMYVKGIRYIDNKVFDYCKNNNLTCVLLGRGKRSKHGFVLSVIPTLVNKNNIIGNIHTNNNCFILNSNNLKNLCFVGEGAGGIPTASNVIRDLMMLKKPYVVKLKNTSTIDYGDEKNTYYISSISKIKEEYVERKIDDNTCITKKINIDTLRKIVVDDKAFIAEVEND